MVLAMKIQFSIFTPLTNPALGATDKTRRFGYIVLDSLFLCQAFL